MDKKNKEIGMLNPQKVTKLKAINIEQNEEDIQEIELLYEGVRVVSRKIVPTVSHLQLVSNLQYRTLFYHPNVRKVLGILRGYIMKIGQRCQFVENLNKYLLVSEYCSGERLTDWFAACRRREDKPEEALKIAIEIAQALSYFHEKDGGLVHLELRPKNIFLTSDNQVKLEWIGEVPIELRNSTFQGDKNKITKNNRKGVSDYGYIAPECFSDNPWVGEVNPTLSSNVYSFGIILYGIFVSLSPAVPSDFHSKSELKDDLKSLVEVVKNGGRPNLMLSTEATSVFSSEIREEINELIRSCWRVEAEERPKIGEIAGILMNILENLYSEQVVKMGLEKLKIVEKDGKTGNFKLPTFLKHLRAAGLGINDKMVMVEAVAVAARQLDIE